MKRVLRYSLIILAAVSVQTACTFMIGKKIAGDTHVRNESALQAKKVELPYRIINGTFLGGNQRNYYGNFCSDSLNLIWKHELGSGKTIVTAQAGVEIWAGAGWTGQPLITEEYGMQYIYQGAYDHHLKKIRLDSGDLVWQYTFDDILKGTGSIAMFPDAADSTQRLVIFQGSRKGLQYTVSDTAVASFRAVSCFSGNEIWRMPMDHTDCYSSDVDASALFLNDRGYIGLENGYFVSFDPLKQLKWNDTASRPELLHKELIYSNSDKAAHGGNLVTEASPVLLGDHVYIASGCGHIFGFNLTTQKFDWDFEIGCDIDGTPVVTSDNCLLIAIEKQYIPGHGGVMKINPARKPENCVDWYYPTGDRNFSSWIGGVIGSVSVNDNYRKENDPYLAAFTGIDGMLTVVNYKELTSDLVAGPDGKTLYPKPHAVFVKEIGPSISTPIFTGGHLVAAGYEGVHVFRHEAFTGFIETDFRAGMFEATPITHDGRVIIASRDGFLYCMGSEAMMPDTISPVINVPIDIVQSTTPQLNKSCDSVHALLMPHDVLAATLRNRRDTISYAEIATTKNVKPEIFGDYFSTSTRRHSKILTALNQKRDSLAAITTVAASKPTQSEIVQGTGSCFLIAGVFRVKENAENYVKRWKERGYPAEMIVQPSGMHYVSIQRGETEEELLSFRNNMQKTTDPSPWVWISQE